MQDTTASVFHSCMSLRWLCVYSLICCLSFLSSFFSACLCPSAEMMDEKITSHNDDSTMTHFSIPKTTNYHHTKIYIKSGLVLKGQCTKRGKLKTEFYCLIWHSSHLVNYTSFPWTVGVCVLFKVKGLLWRFVLLWFPYTHDILRNPIYM